jgi:tetratricopeptide (TPR) repeat protein
MLWVQGPILAREGRWLEAERALNQAISLAQELPYPLLEALALAELGTGYLQRGEGRPGRERLEAALVIFQWLHARPYIEQTQQTLEQLAPPGTEADVQDRQELGRTT